MATTVNLGLVNLEANQFNPEITYNQNLEVLDCLVHLAVESMSLTTPPAGTDGASYVVATGATGAWAGEDGNIAYYYSGWKFIVPNIGFWAYNKSTGEHKYWTGAAWNSPTIGSEFLDSGFRVQYTSDTTAKIAFDVSNVPTSTTITIEAPNSNYVLCKQKLDATTNPTSSDDSGDGYSIGSMWIDTTADHVYICVDASVGSAVWKQLD